MWHRDLLWWDGPQEWNQILEPVDLGPRHPQLPHEAQGLGFHGVAKQPFPMRQQDKGLIFQLSSDWKEQCITRAQAPRAQCYGCNPTKAHKKSFKILLEVEQESQTPENSIQKGNLLINFPIFIFIFFSSSSIGFPSRLLLILPLISIRIALPIVLLTEVNLGLFWLFFGFLNGFFPGLFTQQFKGLFGELPTEILFPNVTELSTYVSQSVGTVSCRKHEIKGNQANTSQRLSSSAKSRVSLSPIALTLRQEQRAHPWLSTIWKFLYLCRKSLVTGGHWVLAFFIFFNFN